MSLNKVSSGKVCVCVYSGLTSLSTFFSHITTVSGCDRELNAHFYSAVSLKYHVPDTWHDTTPSHIILTLGRPVLALPRKSECQARRSLYHFLRLWYVAARDWTRDLPFPGADTLPTAIGAGVVPVKSRGRPKGVRKKNIMDLVIILLKLLQYPTKSEQ